ncbi:MAG: hypothetical protein HYS80_01410 [Candidatus Aenigmarchaeota archaeon]|nr:hypothetical protein [Candidatus Aenigmarchaeota archaeon]
MCKHPPSVPLTILPEEGPERTVKIQVTDIYDSQEAADRAANPTIFGTWTDDQCGSGFGNFHPRCKVFNVMGKNGDNLTLEAEGSFGNDTGYWTFSKESKGWLCVRYMSNKPDRWHIKCTQVFNTAADRAVTTPTPSPSPTTPSYAIPTSTAVPSYAPVSTPTGDSRPSEERFGAGSQPNSCTPRGDSCQPGQICNNGVCILDPDDTDVRTDI